jgi:hypothetical protein
VNTFFRESFDKDLSAITDAGLLRRIQKMIEQVEAARTFQEIPNLSALRRRGNISAFDSAIIASALFLSRDRSHLCVAFIAGKFTDIFPEFDIARIGRSCRFEDQMLASARLIAA